jgi:hypothetical protein
MKIAAAEALAKIAREPVVESVSKVYPDRVLRFGADYVIPTPFDPRLMGEISVAVAKAAMDCGVARTPITDFEAYRQQLQTLQQNLVGKSPVESLGNLKVNEISNKKEEGPETSESNISVLRSFVDRFVSSFTSGKS